MTNKLFGAFLLLFTYLLLFSCTKEVIDISTPDTVPPDTSDSSVVGFCDTITYATHITDFFSTHCNSCHPAIGGPGDFSNYSEVKLAIDDKELEARVLDPAASPMPPSGGLTTEEKDRLKCWIDAGAPNN